MSEAFSNTVAAIKQHLAAQGLHPIIEHVGRTDHRRPLGLAFVWPIDCGRRSGIAVTELLGGTVTAQLAWHDRQPVGYETVVNRHGSEPDLNKGFDRVLADVLDDCRG